MTRGYPTFVGLKPVEIKSKQMNMKKLISISLSAFAFFILSCGGGEETTDPVQDSLKTEIGNRDNTITEKERAIQDFVNAFNEISLNLDSIKMKEKIVASETSGGDVKSKEEQIKADITAIYQLLGKNKSRLYSLNKKFKAANLKIEGLEQMIANMQKQIDEKDMQIGELKNKIENLNIELGNLQANITLIEEESQVKTEKLNTAFYCMGTGKELKEKGVTTKEGGVLGLGKTMTLKTDFNRDYFTKVDISQFSEVVIAAKRAKVLTTHPSGSYKLVGEKSVEKLVITNAEDFWSTSKYLVIITE